MKKHFSDEKIISILLEGEAGVSAFELCVSMPLKSLEEVIARLKQLLAEAVLDKKALQVALWRKY